MSKIFRFIAALAVITLVCCALAACDGNKTPAETTTNDGTPPAADGTTTPTGDTSAPAGETTAPDMDYTAKHDFYVVKDGKAACRIVCPADASKDEIAFADAIIESVKSSTGVTLEKVAACGADSEAEIVVGHGVYDKASAIYDRVSYGQWAVTTCANKLVVFFTDDASLADAKKLLGRYLGEADGSTLMLAAKLMGTETSTAMTIPVPVLRETGNPAYIQKVGGVDTSRKCAQVTFKSVSADVYNRYVARLEALGYKKLAQNEISKNVFVTMANDKHMLTVDYIPNGRVMRIISEPAYEKYIGELESGERKGAVKLMQIQDPGPGSDHPSSYVVTLADGRYFLYDTGYGTDNTSTAPQLMEYMRKNNTFTDGKVHIAAIFISHPHPDHMNGIKHLADAYGSEIVCDAVMYNLVSVDMQSVLSTDTLNARQNEINAAAKKMGASVYCVRAGQQFTLSGTQFQVLFTPDELGDYPLTGKNSKGESDTNYDINNSSVILTMLESGQSVTFMGDCRGGEATKLRSMYTRGFPGDIMEVAHHGFNVVATLDLYDMAHPSVLLWPIRRGSMDTSRSFVKQLLAAKYVKQHFYEDEQVELTLPYNP